MEQLNILTPAYIALASALLFFILPENKRFSNVLNMVAALLILVTTYRVFRNPAFPEFAKMFLHWDRVVGFIYIFTGLFTFLFALFSIAYITKNFNAYYCWFYATVMSTYLVILINNWFLFIIFWSISGIALYLLIQSQGGAAQAAGKSIIIFGLGDAVLVLAVAMIYINTRSFAMQNGTFNSVIFICLLITAFAKAGVMPFHTWIPDLGEQSPATATALLPGSLDKFLGVYMLYRIFELYNPPEIYRLVVMAIGGFTIIAAVFMALRQHSGKRLLSYHIVSQVGYMVVGIASGTLIGIVGGLFHLLNNTIYKSALLLGTGYIEKETGTDQLEKLGGLSKVYPFTFVSMLIAALSISGIPPFNGFYSKWIIYQTLVDALGGRLNFVISLILLSALFGSALTLASFVKLIHSIFLGGRVAKHKAGHESVAIILPQLILAALCIILGLWAKELFIEPIFGKVDMPGIWQPVMTGILYTAGIVVGLILVLLNSMKIRRDTGFIGGEVKSEAMKMSGVEFYTSIENIKPFRLVYRLADNKVFDFYYIGRYIVAYLKGLLGFLHSGLISNYIAWVFLGMIILFVLGR